MEASGGGSECSNRICDGNFQRYDHGTDSRRRTDVGNHRISGHYRGPAITHKTEKIRTMCARNHKTVLISENYRRSFYRETSNIILQTTLFCRAVLCIRAAYAVARSVCLSVCLPVWPSVTLVYSVETNKRIFTIFSSSGNHTIAVFLYETLQQYSDVTGVSNAVGMKKSPFLSRVSILMRNIDIVNLSFLCPSICPSDRYVPVSDENGLTYNTVFFTIL